MTAPARHTVPLLLMACAGHARAAPPLPPPPSAAASPSRSETWASGRRSTAPVSPSVVGEPAPSTTDGAYDRFDGNLELSMRGGVEVQATQAVALLGAAAHYYSSAGLRVAWGQALDTAGARPRGGLTLAVDLQPAFLPRWSKGLERGPATLDLLLDSLSVSVGPYWQHTALALLDRRGLDVSLGVGVPLLGRAAGPWLDARGGLRWLEAKGTEAPTTEAAGQLCLAWHVFALL